MAKARQQGKTEKSQPKQFDNAEAKGVVMNVLRPLRINTTH